MCSIMGYLGDSLTKDEFREHFDRTISRGPDMQRMIDIPGGIMGFERLSIMGLGEEGMQPFNLNNNFLVCNGEIYGFRPIREDLKMKGYTFKSDSDCELLLPMYEQYGTDMFAKLDAEFACIIYDGKERAFIAARDPIGIRPLYYGHVKSGTAADKSGIVADKSGLASDKSGFEADISGLASDKSGLADNERITDEEIIFASEAKNLVGLVDEIFPFPPGHYYKDGEFICYNDITWVDRVVDDDVDTICKNIHDKLVKGIEKRLDSDAPVGFLLSGGLDSSLVCAVASKLSDKPIRTFAIGMNTDAIDLKYAKQVADYLGSDHTEVIITKEDVIRELPGVIKLLGTYDITTIRASMGMYLVCKAIHEQTDIRVLLTGEISDELFGYKYTDFAPSPEEFQKEAVKRIHEIHMYDVLRADRCISVNSLEARVPFGDLDFVKYVMSIDPAKKMNVYNKGKYLLRHAFEGDYLPYDILMREKAAFSDAVGHSMVDHLKEYAEGKYSDKEYEELIKKYDHARPFTKESLLYREIFEEFYPGQSRMVKDFWMPNKEWEGCDVNDPSARVLSNYGASGE